MPPLPVLLRAMYVLGSIWLFLGFSDLPMVLSASVSSSFVSEVQGKTGTEILTLSHNPHCVKCYTNAQPETAVMSKGWQQKRTGQEKWAGNRYPLYFCPFWTQRCSNLTRALFLTPKQIFKRENSSHSNSSEADLIFF